MGHDNKLVYYKMYDMWILEKTSLYIFEPELTNNNEIIFVGGWLPDEEQIDLLLDLILEKNGNEKYYKEILDKIITNH